MSADISLSLSTPKSRKGRQAVQGTGTGSAARQGRQYKGKCSTVRKYKDSPCKQRKCKPERLGRLGVEKLGGRRSRGLDHGDSRICHACRAQPHHPGFEGFQTAEISGVEGFGLVPGRTPPFRDFSWLKSLGQGPSKSPWLPRCRPPSGPPLFPLRRDRITQQRITHHHPSLALSFLSPGLWAQELPPVPARCRAPDRFGGAGDGWSDATAQRRLKCSMPTEVNKAQ